LERIYSKPGGDKIGRRRLDTHFEGFINLGANFVTTEDHFMVLKLKWLDRC
jgi:UDP-N-acetylglucosamine 1-carboxyvinyltransferase